jgi:hypothetical protein
MCGSSHSRNNPLICSLYRDAMAFDVGNVTVRAAVAARDALLSGAQPASERAMAAVARHALFTEALLGALKARVAEFKSVAK